MTWLRMRGLRRVYPRVCGGTADPRSYVPFGLGLSPRVRGNRSGVRLAGDGAGSIPACAGEPSPAPPGLHRRGVYPRVCGGTANTDDAKHTMYGLSPRVRGNPTSLALSGNPARSIPACAGEPAVTERRREPYTVYPRVCGGTCGLPGAVVRRGVYPRVCGGTLLCCPLRGAICGLSPRVRGNLAQFPVNLGCDGSIPACAGEPLRAGKC